MVRDLVERLTASWVFTRRLPGEFGGVPIRVTPSGGLRYLFKPMDKIDPVLLRLVDRLVHEGDVVWDVGANLGLWSFAAAQRAGSAGRVIALEPDTWLVSLLRDSAALQPRTSASVTVVPAAATDRPALVVLQIASRSRASNALMGFGHTQMGPVREKQVVAGLSLDWLLSQPGILPPRIVKIDVEGAEVLVLRGSAALLRDVRPTIVVEVGSGEAAEISRLLRDARYQIFDGDTFGDGGAQTPLETAPWTCVAIPMPSQVRVSPERVPIPPPPP